MSLRQQRRQLSALSLIGRVLVGDVEAIYAAAYSTVR